MSADHHVLYLRLEISSPRYHGLSLFLTGSLAPSWHMGVAVTPYSTLVAWFQTRIDWCAAQGHHVAGFVAVSRTLCRTTPAGGLNRLDVIQRV